MEETRTRHKKELKTLEGEKRAALKKQKGSKGKMSKDALQALEDEYAEKLRDMQERHVGELAAFAHEGQEEATEAQEATAAPSEIDLENRARERKQEKSRRKREKERQKQQEKEAEIEQDLQGPSARKLELEILQSKLDPMKLDIVEVESDGHCLYRAVAAQCPDDMAYPQIRELCATILKQHKDDFSPFCEYTDTIGDFETYVERVKSSADWGGHVELRALSLGLKRPIVVYSAFQDTLHIHEEFEGEPIRLSYHLKYYSLGEHYNYVAPKTKDENDVV